MHAARLAGLLVLAAAPAPADVSAPASFARFYPYRSGTELVYDSDAGRTVVYRFTEGEGRKLSVEVSEYLGSGRTVRHLERRPEGLFLMRNEYESGSTMSMGSGYPLLVRGLRKGKPRTFEFDGKYLKQDRTFRVTITAKGYERIEVPAGRFTCLRVRMRVQWGTGGVRNLESVRDYWYAKGVGMVRLVFRDSADAEPQYELRLRKIRP